LGQIHKLEDTLREAFESGANEGGVVFLENDTKNGIVPCAPSKIATSDVVTVGSNDFYLPTGFDTLPGKTAKTAIQQLTASLDRHSNGNPDLVDISLDEAISLIELSMQTMKIGRGASFQWDAMTSLLKYYCAANESDVVQLLVEKGRKLDRESSGEKSGLSVLGTKTRAIFQVAGRKKPALVMLEQEGSKSLNWAADNPFWWPVLATPSGAEPCVFAHAAPSSR